VVEILERMLGASSLSYDMDDKLKQLLRRLSSTGEKVFAIRAAERLSKSLPEMLELYKSLVN